MKKGKIIVFGATGNIGAYSTMKLKLEGFDVIAVGGRKSDNGFFTSSGIPYYSVDIRQKDSFYCLPTKDIYACVHFAGALPSRYEYNPGLFIDSITVGTLNVLEYLKSSGGRKIVFAQTPFDSWYLHNTMNNIPADGLRSFPPTGDHSIYTIAKNAAVDLIEHYYSSFGIARFILRFFTIYQYHPNPYHYGDGIRKIMPYRILIDKAMKGETIEIWGDPSRRKEIVYIKDFTQVVHKTILSELDGGIYNVGGEKTVSLEEQILGIIEVFSPKDKKSQVVYCPEKPNALQASLDISKTRKELGYDPQYSYLDAMRDLYEEMKSEPFAALWGRKEDFKF